MKKLKILAVEKDIRVNDLLEEAISDFSTGITKMLPTVVETVVSTLEKEGNKC